MRVWGCVVETETEVVVEGLEATYVGVIFDGTVVGVVSFVDNSELLIDGDFGLCSG